MNRPSAAERRTLRRIGHHLQPVIIVGDNGLSEGVIAETERALADHELIKVRLPAAERGDRQTIADTLGSACDAAIIQSIGRMVLLYRPAERPDPRKSNVLRHQAG